MNPIDFKYGLHCDATFCVVIVFMAGVASQTGDIDSCLASGLSSGFQGSMNGHFRTL